MIFNFLIILGFILLSAFLGKFVLDRLHISIFNNALSDYIVGLLFIEAICFTIFLISSGIFKLGFWVSILPIIPILIWYIASDKSRYGPKIKVNKKSVILISIVFIGLSSWFVFEAKDHIIATITNDGIIYQDILYHSGITNAILEFGYPIQQLQYDGEVVRYHIFTHFIAAQWSFISGIESYRIYVLVFYFVFTLCISILMHDIVKDFLKEQFTSFKYFTIVIISFFGSYFLGAGLASNFMASYLFSYSYQWQLIIFLILVGFIINIKNGFNSHGYIILLFLFITAILSKGSALPLLLVGFGSLFLNKVIINKKINLKDLIFLICSGIVGIFIFKVFFSSGVEGSLINQFGFNEKFIGSPLSTVIIQKLGINNFTILLINLIFCIMAYRIYSLKFIRIPVVAFSFGMSIIGLLFFLFFKNNPGYFLIPAMFINSFVISLFILRNWFNTPTYLKFGLITLIVFSIYPFSSFGFGVKKKLDNKSFNYIPLSENRLALYRYIKNSTHNTDVIFTPSVYATNNFVGDNYYPAALTRRKFFLGGYRFGGLSLKMDFDNRLDMVDNFSKLDSNFILGMKKNDLKYILLESKGNKKNLESLFVELRNSKVNSIKILFDNDAGIFIEII
jgi:hypothetical protein